MSMVRGGRMTRRPVGYASIAATSSLIAARSRDVFEIRVRNQRPVGLVAEVFARVDQVDDRGEVVEPWSQAHDLIASRAGPLLYGSGQTISTFFI